MIVTRSVLLSHLLTYFCKYLSHIYFFFFNDTATTEIYTLSLHDALPISIADLRRVAVAETDIWQLLVGVDLEQRQVGAAVAADDLRGVLFAALQRHFDLARLTGDVIVRHDMAVGLGDEARVELHTPAPPA